MGRRRSFDETQVLDRAADRFWSHGYSATSIRDLERAMEMNSASLYNAFGDKKALFHKALQRYLDRSSRRRVALMDESDDPRIAIAEFLHDIVEASCRHRDGCLLINAATEVAAHDRGIGDAVAAAFDEIEGGFQRAVLRAKADGTISPLIDADQTAKALVGTVVSIRVMSRTGVAADYLRALAVSQLDRLGEPPAQRVGNGAGDGPMPPTMGNG